MDSTRQFEFYGRIKVAEGELSEAFWKMAEGEAGTALACLKEAVKNIDAAVEMLLQ